MNDTSDQNEPIVQPAQPKVKAADLLPFNAPEELKVAERELHAANNELTVLFHQIALWRAMAYNRELPDRLGNSYVGRGSLTVRMALFNGAVLSVSRLFDGTRTSLDLNKTFGRLLKSGNTAWLRECRVEVLLDLPVVNQDGQPWCEDVWAALQKVAQKNATEVGIMFDKEVEEFKLAKKRFTAGDAGSALERLQALRNKEIAHTDLQPQWATPRPKFIDLDTVIEALKDLLVRANRLCTGLDINARLSSQTAEIAAQCFVMSLRMETRDERKAVTNGLYKDLSIVLP